MERQKGSPSLLWPAILITAGILLLLNNLGYLSWGVWARLLSLWPVLLIAVGLEILVGRRSVWASALIVLLVVAVFVGVAWVDRLPGGRQIVASSGQSVQVVQKPLDGAERAAIEIDFSVGELRVDALEVGEGLVKGSLDLLSGEEFTQSYHKDGSTAVYQFGSTGSIGLPQLDLRDDEHVWDIGLTREIPLDLTIKAGIGSSDVDLTRLNLTGLSAENGIGKMVLRLPRTGKFEADVHVGIGEVTIVVPEGLSARIRGEAGLGELDVNEGFVRRGDWYESSGYASATDRVDLRVHGGIGKVSVVTQPAG